MAVKKGRTGNCRGAGCLVRFLPEMKVKAIAMDDWAGAAIEAIAEAASTDQIGDGKVFMFDVEKAMRIRRGETAGDVL